MKISFKNLFFILLVNTLILGLIFFLANYFSKFRLAETRNQFISTEDAEFYKYYSAKMNHLRAFEFQKKMYQDIPKKTTDFLFTSIGTGSREVLIQGDSWAEQLILGYPSFFALQIFSEQENLRFIVGGAGSFSPSLMQAQLRVLRDDFNMTPLVIVGIIDQTDIGDELCRYQMQVGNDDSGYHIVRPYDSDLMVPYNISHYFKLLDILDAPGLPLLKLIKYKYNKMRMPSIGGCSREILQPLMNGVTQREYAYVSARITAYIEEVFRHGATNHLILVTHFHRDHVSGNYKFDVGSIVDEAIVNSKFKNGITHLKFEPENYKVDSIDAIFVRGDIFSHLTDYFHRKIYTRDILRQISLALDPTNNAQSSRLH